MPHHRDPANLHDVHRAGPENEKLAHRLVLARDLIWVFLGLAAVMSCVQFFVDPQSVERSSLGRNLSGSIDDIWNIAWGLGGALIIYGVIARHNRLEIIGQIFFLAGIIPNAIAIVINVGGGPSFWTVLVAGVANVGRLYYLWHTTPRRR